MLGEHQSFRVGISPDAAMGISRQLKLPAMDACRAPFDRPAESQAGTAFCGRDAVRFSNGFGAMRQMVAEMAAEPFLQRISNRKTINSALAD
ncbi:hypothetical protein [Burkholderia sp. ABCPW 14]|uniref:hypothetical protein n=1 Tax=Burkholderia sp. ABCPW 14 TaxID=1637860 RepID=UPI0012E3F78C|nr:hypothetical protein [Burkholderia sp. ABCPW 14]